MNLPSRKCRLSRPKRIVFCLVIGAALAGAIEIISLIGLWIVDGRVSLAKLRQEQFLATKLVDSTGTTAVALHPYMGWVLDPDWNGVRWFDSRDWPVNDFGFLDRQSPIQKRSEERTIVCILGGSVALDLSLTASQVLVDELKKSSTYQNREIVIVRLAMGAYKQPQQLLVLNYFLSLGAEFDIVINIDGVNEVSHYPGEPALRDVFYAYPRAWSHHVSQHPDGTSLLCICRMDSLKKVRRDISQAVYDQWWGRTMTASFLWKCMDSIAQRSIQSELAYMLSHRQARRKTYTQVGPPNHFSDDEEMLQELANLWWRSSVQINQVCRENGIRYFHFLQPNQYIKASKPMGAEESDIAISAGQPLRPWIERGYPLLQQMAVDKREKEGVRFYDLAMLFNTTMDPVYVDNCCHYNQTGNELLATAIAHAVVESPRAALP